MNIKTTEFKNFIRAPFVFPGGYALYMVAQDCGAICYKCAKENARLIIESTRRQSDQGWAFYAANINWEDVDVYCDHCGAQIEPEYCADNDDADQE